MKLSQRQKKFTVAEYLEAERATDERNEYLDGFVYQMESELPEHGTICSNLTGILSTQLRKTDCYVFCKGIKVYCGWETDLSGSSKWLISYPDIVITLGKPESLNGTGELITNPLAIVEVVSPATERRDRLEKWLRYQRDLPSLRVYILVNQTWPVIEMYQRMGTAFPWTYSSQFGSLLIPKLDCELVLKDVYDRIEFPPADDREDGEAA